MPERVPDIIQTNFGGGQINPSGSRRDDEVFVKTGALQMANFRIEAIGTLVNRPCWRPIFPVPGWRTEYVRMQAGAEFMVNFGVVGAEGCVTIYSLDGTSFIQNVSANYIWALAELNQISFCVAEFDLVICFPSMQPQIARWSPAYQTWTFLPYSFRVINSQSQEPFYRFSVPGATMTYGGLTGNVTLTCSEPYFQANMVGEILSIVGQQCTIQSITDSQHAVVNIAYRFPDTMWLAIEDARPFEVGMIAELRDQDLKVEIGAAGSAVSIGIPWFTDAIRGVMLSNLVCDFSQFIYAPYDPTTNPTGPDVLISPIGSSAIAGYPFAYGGGGEPTVEWTEEFMCAQRGWPSCCAYTAGRLCFYGFPQMQEAILWSATSANDVCWVDPVAAENQPEAGANADAAILEFEASRPLIVRVVEWGDLFVFTDRGIFQVPVSQAAPLAPGNVEFRRFSNDGVAPITPVSTQDAIVYINTGLNRCSVVRATGSLTRPYISDDVSESHAPLFTGPVSLSIATGDGLYPERHVYVVNLDGSIVVGKFTQQRTLIGWVPWTTSGGVARWVTNAGPKVWRTTEYSLVDANGDIIATNYLVELEDQAHYLDGMALLNSHAPGMVNGTLGPMWHLSGAKVTIVDDFGVTASGPGTGPPITDYGEREVDMNGNIIFEPADAAWSGSTTVYAGLWSPPVYQPFLFPPKEGTAKPGARGKRRKISRAVITVQQSNGFTFGKRQIPPLDWNEPPEQPEGLNNSSAWQQD